MNKIILTTGLLSMLILAGYFQNVSKGKVNTEEKGKGFYYELIMKDVTAVEEKLTEKEPFVRFVMDQSGMDLPNNQALYKTVWSNSTESQGNAGTCGSFQPRRFTNQKYFANMVKKLKSIRPIGNM